MANGEELKTIAKARLKTAEILIEAKDWDGAAYMMGYVLECALKAVVCKTLNLLEYPQYTKNKKTDGYFMTHEFDQLLIASGLESLFSTRGSVDAFQYWSDFTKEYPTDWPSMRYSLERQKQFDETKVKKLYTILIEKDKGILEIIENQNKW
jgi:HEPN domain